MSVRLVTVTDYIHLQRPNIEWIVPALIPRPSLLMLMGAPKAGKTFLAVDIAASVALGKPVLGLPCVATRVLYVQLDTREVVWRNTLRKLQESGVTFGDDLVLVHPEDYRRPVNILGEDTQRWFREMLDVAKPGFVVLDVLREMHNGDENDSTSMKLVGDQIEKIFRECAVLLVHHSKKLPEDVEDPSISNASRGSSYITGKMDGLLLLHKTMLKIETRFDEVRRLKAVREENGMWSFPDVIRDKEVVAKVLKLCEEFLDVSHNRLAKLAGERFGISRATYFRHLGGRDCAHRAKSEGGQELTSSSGDSSKEKKVLTELPNEGNFVHTSAGRVVNPATGEVVRDVSVSDSNSDANPVAEDLHAQVEGPQAAEDPVRVVQAAVSTGVPDPSQAQSV